MAMKKEQIQMLRELIMGEIRYETRWSGDSYSLIVKESLNKKWKEFAETFSSTPTEPLEIDV
jgi:hypothetical protein